MSFNELKAAKEAFVTGHTGTSMHEVVLVTLIGPVAVVLLRVLRAHWLRQATWPTLLALELLVLVIPTIVAFTQPHLAPWLMLGMLLIAVGLHFYQRLSSGSKTGYLELPDLWASRARQQVVTQRLGRSTRSRFLSHYRGGMLLVTIISILAVDFTIFPRRFAKCESFGVSLMDCGVGSFVFANALVSRQARRISSRASVGWVTVLRAAKSVAPLLVLGLVRLVVNKALQYQEHVSEYGVHWNFFFTMATVAVLSAVVDVVAARMWDQVPTAFYVALSVVVCVVYQLALFLGLEKFVLSAPRDTLFSQNREGVLGSAGFLALFMLGVAVGRCLNRAKQYGTPWPKLLSLTAGVALTAWGAAMLSDTFIAPVSRRMTNMSYVIWILAYNMVQLTALLVAELVWALPTQPPVVIVLAGLNDNGLALFLLANVMTGLVNMGMVTIYASQRVAYVVVCAYTGAVAAAAAGLYRRVKLKVW